jgi:SRSO17 transposase
MDADQIAHTGAELKHFLAEFDDCFVRSEPRGHLRTYVAGQLSGLLRKSIEPIALAAGTAPRTLQRFLESMAWDHERLRDRLQGIVVRDHSHPRAIGTIDESGYPKKGRHTAAVQRQWCGNTGKIDNCVVGVHLGYVAGDFHCLLDSDLYLPESWANDGDRCRAAGIPDEIVYRKKTRIALDQVAWALANGIRVEAWTFDEWYGRDGEFLEGMERLGQNYVGEVPSTLTGWLREPKILVRPTPAQTQKRGRKPRFPRLARKALAACEVRNLVTYSRVFQRQPWVRFHVKDGENGPMVWEVKHALFYPKRPDGLPGPMHSLVVARNVLEPDILKYFLSNRAAGSPGVLLEDLVRVAFSRWPIEQCFEQAKNELGLDHFEVRSWEAIHRHLYVTQLSHLFCARVHQRLREKNDREPLPHRRAGPRGGVRLGRGPILVRPGPTPEVPRSGRADRVLPTPQPASPTVPYENHPTTPSQTRNQDCSVEVLCAG